MARWVLIVLTFVVTGVAWVLLSAAYETPPRPSITADCSKQQARVHFIADLRKQRIIHKVEQTGTLPHIYVAPRFYALTIDEKQAFIGVFQVYYWCAGQHALLVLVDSRTGKDIGRMTTRFGLEIY